MYQRKLEECLKRVQKPARYIGNEFNSIHKEWTSDKMSVAFCFPDVYEVGMSHLGMKILYHMLNEREDTICERVLRLGMIWNRKCAKRESPCSLWRAPNRYGILI